MTAAELSYFREWGTEVPEWGWKNELVTTFGLGVQDFYLAAHVDSVRAVGRLYEVQLRDPTGTVRATGGYFTRGADTPAQAAALRGQPVLVAARASFKWAVHSRGRFSIEAIQAVTQSECATASLAAIRDALARHERINERGRRLAEQWAQKWEPHEDKTSLRALEALRRGQASLEGLAP
jgi:hypothetical protein